MKKWQIGVLACFLLIVSAGAYVLVQARTLEVERLSDDLFVLRGLGGNTAVLRTDAGAVVVDSMTLQIQGQRIPERARELTGMDTTLLINTHYHLDHTHGNVAFELGTRVLSTERTLSHLHVLDAEFWQGDAARLLPTETFTDRMTLVDEGYEQLGMIIPLPMDREFVITRAWEETTENFKRLN